jgi:phosphate transport system protein
MEELRKSFGHQIDDLKKALLEMGGAAEVLIENAVRALIEKDVKLAESVITGDDAIDHMEYDIESRCLKLLALQQPMAIDLRVISGALKIVTDIERLADHATKIAKQAIILAGMPQIKPYVDLPMMAGKVITMLKLSLDAFSKIDVGAAKSIIALDDEIDEYNRKIFTELVDFMIKDSKVVGQVSHLMSVVHSLERIADHVTNICERIIFVSTGVPPKADHSGT